MLGAVPIAAQMPTQATMRSLNGTVTDAGHEPIRGAIVELRNESSHALVTYITETNGSYNFKRLDGNTDYVVWVVYRGKHSTTHTISKFDSHMDKVIDFTVQTF
ncbi:MAG: carboxypeptidase-like regulatory domain-containing protein [Pseudomonadota bacterium]|nr:carboxypeptidase-like regulatory domain-containing protein [Pseudomonadota bacterium]